jgi:hypothetical protein
MNRLFIAPITLCQLTGRMVVRPRAFRRNGAPGPEVLEHWFRWFWCRGRAWGRSVSDGLAPRVTSFAFGLVNARRASAVRHAELGPLGRDELGHGYADPARR